MRREVCAIIRNIFKIIISLSLALSSLIAGTECRLKGQEYTKGNKIDMSRFTLVWSDEFDGDTLDRDKWDFSWWITERKGGYWHEDMVRVENGNLIISAEYKDEPLPFYYEQADWIKPYKAGWYSGKVVTRNKYEQTYGYFEVRCILPAATGLWSAFWLMNDDGVYNVDNSGKDGTEVDVFESFYYKDYRWGGDCVSSGIHYDGYGEDSKGDTIGKSFIKNDPYAEYNTYGVEWNKDEYIFYINGEETGRTSKGGVSQNPEYLLLSVEFAGENGVQSSDRHGTGEISKTPEENWPAEFKVDYVRCYQYRD